MPNTYWNNNGKHQADYDRLIAFMPAKGNCGSVEIEAIRAASKIYHELNNNGFKFNNWSGAYNFLNSLGIDGVREELLKLDEYKFGQSYYSGDWDDEISHTVENIANLVIEWVLAREKANGGFEESKVDMWDFSEPSPPEPYDDEEEEEDDESYED